MSDYIVVGQGICGTFLSYYLLQAGKSVLVIDNGAAHTASRVASGIINPVTGRRIVKTWLIEEVMPFARHAYTEMGKQLGASFIRQCNVLDFFATPQMKEAFEARSHEEESLLQVQPHNTVWQPVFRYNYGIGEISPCYLTDVRLLLHLWREHLKQHQLLAEDEFNIADCTIERDGVRYRQHSAEKIIFCEGATGTRNPFFSRLPFSLNKGEALIAEIPGLPRYNIYKQGISLVPWGEDNLFWIGSNYLWNYDDVQPTALFRQKVEAQLSYWLQIPFRIVEHLASERPANVERRPFVGLHPQNPSVGIVNGMGTKGCSLAPFFCYQMAQHLLHNSPIEPLTDVKRFARVLSR